MPDELDNLTLQLLREIRQSQTEHGDRLVHIEQRIDELHETMYTVSGFAMHANVRHDTVTSRLNTLEQRIRHLEEKA
jgi:polyhydroxyalkanoate synthesis regulator phasin